MIVLLLTLNPQLKPVISRFKTDAGEHLFSSVKGSLSYSTIALPRMRGTNSAKQEISLNPAKLLPQRILLADKLNPNRAFFVVRNAFPICIRRGYKDWFSSAKFSLNDV